MRFISIDVETANPDIASICSIGIAKFEDGSLVSEWGSLIDPESYFDPISASIHGISETDVCDAPTFRDIADHLARTLNRNVVVSHTHFDRMALAKAASRAGIELPSCTWIDSARVARRTWAKCEKSGYGLKAVCRLIGYEFKHHDALEDAKAAGAVLLAAMKKTNLDLDGIRASLFRPINPATAEPIRRDGNPDGPLAGEVIVFTGALELSRREAADIASAAGCEVASGVTKKTTLLVVGDVDIAKLAGHEKSSKHRKAEELILAGAPLRILQETDFRQLVRLR